MSDTAASVDQINWTVEALTDTPLPAVWVLDLDLLTGLPPPTATEEASAREYPEPVWARRFLARRAAARLLASRAIGCDPGALDLDRNTRGGLHFVTPRPPWRVSISHRGPHAAIGLVAGQIGVDLENAGEARVIPWNVLHPDETAALEGLAPELRTPAFLRLWTVKEAYLKLLGLGFAREPSSFAVRGMGGQPSIEDRMLEGRTPLVATRILSGLGPEDLVVSCVAFPAGT